MTSAGTSPASGSAHRGRGAGSRRSGPGGRGRAAAHGSGEPAVGNSRPGAREFPTQGSAALRPVERAAVVPAEQVASPRLRVAPPAPIRVPRAPFAALVVVLVVGGVLGILAVNTKINENAFRLDELQQQQAKLDVEQQQLKKQIAESESPGNLAAQARRLGLVESDELAYIRLPDGKVIGVPQPAGGPVSIASQQGAEG
nr:septum formation initiator family protein [Micromonospora tarapacensis]